MFFVSSKFILFSIYLKIDTVFCTLSLDHRLFLCNIYIYMYFHRSASIIVKVKKSPLLQNLAVTVRQAALTTLNNMTV